MGSSGHSDFVPKVAPLDDDGFVRSFDVDGDGDALLSFFDEYGFAVVRDVLSDGECAATLDEFFAKIPGVQNAAAEELERFYAEQPFGFAGIIGKAPDWRSPTQLANRQNEKTY